MFRTLYTEQKRFFSSAGDRFVPQFDSKINANGVLTLEETGKYDLYDEIQSYKDSCDVKTILARFHSGETDVLEKYTGAYLDTTEFPKTYAEFQQHLINANNMFDSLPSEMKQKFNNSVSEFFAQFGSDEWSDKLGILQKPEESLELEKPPESPLEVS